MLYLLPNQNTCNMCSNGFDSFTHLFNKYLLSAYFTAATGWVKQMLVYSYCLLSQKRHILNQHICRKYIIYYYKKKINGKKRTEKINLHNGSVVIKKKKSNMVGGLSGITHLFTLPLTLPFGLVKSFSFFQLHIYESQEK